MVSQCSKPVTPGARACQWQRSAANCLRGSQLQYPTLMAKAQPRAVSSRRTSRWKNAASMRNSSGSAERVAEPSAHTVDHRAEERRRLLGIVDVAGPVLEPQDVPGLRHVGQERVVTGILAGVGIEAAKGPADRGPGADDGAIDVEREARQLQTRQGIEHDLRVESKERPERGVNEPAPPIGDGARRRQPGEPTEAADERVADEILQMLDAPGPHVEQGEQQQAQPCPAVVTAHGGARPSQAGQQAEAARIAAEQLQAAVRRELLGNELDRQIPLDHLPQAAYAQAHQRGLRELRDDMGMSALWIRWQAPLIHADLNLTRSAFSDWG